MDDRAVAWVLGGDLLSHGLSAAVPSALEGLTCVFGMGTGVPPPLKPPRKTREYISRQVSGEQVGKNEKPFGILVPVS